jgi:nucleotide-binding universal stress UspA family protein
MYEKILVALEDSDMAERVLVAARELATMVKGEVLVLHVWEADPSKYKSPTTMSYEDACILVETAEKDLVSAGVRATSEVAANLHCYAASEITRRAKAQDVGVIVIGSRRQGDLKALLAGSTAHKVIHMADRPVFVVP